MQSVSPVFTDEEVQLEFQTVKTDSKYVGVIGLPVTLAILDPKTENRKRFRIGQFQPVTVSARKSARKLPRGWIL
jgi:hypothetical protein